MRFQLVRKSTGRVLTTFHITNSKNDICGSINVPNSEAADLQKHWRGAYAPPAAKPGVKPVALPRLSKQAVLRGC